MPQDKRWFRRDARPEEIEQGLRDEKARMAEWDRQLNEDESRWEAQYGPVPPPPDLGQTIKLWGVEFQRSEYGGSPIGRPVAEMPWGEGYINGTCDLFGNPINRGNAPQASGQFTGLDDVEWAKRQRERERRGA